MKRLIDKPDGSRACDNRTVAACTRCHPSVGPPPSDYTHGLATIAVPECLFVDLRAHVVDDEAANIYNTNRH